MSTLITPTAGPPYLEALSDYRFTVAQYHRLLTAGILKDGERVELLEGRLVNKVAQHPPQAGTTLRLSRRLPRWLPDDWLVRSQLPILLRDSEPEPDFAIVPAPEETWDTRHPKPDEVALIIEVSDATLADDRLVKGRIYARARLVEYWIVNLVDAQVEVYTHPRGGRVPAYRQRKDYGKKDAVPLTLAGKHIRTIAVRELLP
jgi:hypothetical protein